ncbi:Hsp20 family protein [Asticcacaulis sp. BYS171W]|uniref:Hsp20 family protein n=1 Tax=Asticcacaulis aquaticus TaxID=2984212 RepID=A0ABT5HS72_9CAUL|nr:Hsp20 family protein [Asticcacaulis aquaticus]MDC7682902.1 Hsp20 family protein [Asticcacaulis aquaticus]
MSRFVVFDSPFLLGFDETRVLIERVSRTADNYPPYNVEALGPSHLRLSIAVAGFTRDQLQLSLQGSHLTLQVMKDKDDGAPRDFIHRGIAQRGFSRSFVVAQGFEVSGARLEHGLLHIDLNRPEPSDEVRIIPISH